MRLKPPDDTIYEEQPTPAQVFLAPLGLCATEPVNAFDTLIKDKEDKARVAEVVAATGINDILQAVGVIAAAPTTAKTEEKNNARKIFSEAGGTLEAAAKQITHVMRFGDKTAEQLQAARIVAQIHGALEELDTQKAPTVNINITPMSNSNNSILNLVTPRV